MYAYKDQLHKNFFLASYVSHVDTYNPFVYFYGTFIAYSSEMHRRLSLKAVYDDTPYRASNICFWYPVAVGLTRTLQSPQSPFCTYSTSHPDRGTAVVNRKPSISSLALGSKGRPADSLYWATQRVF